MTMLLLTRQYQEVNFNTRGSTMPHQEQQEQPMEPQFKEFWAMLREMGSFLRQQAMLKRLSFQQHQVFSGANNANIC